MRPLAIRIRRIGIAYGQEHEVGCIVTGVIMDDALKCPFDDCIVGRSQQIMDQSGIHQPRPSGDIQGGEILRVPVQILLLKLVIHQDMLVA
ncbi:hypothetical protein A1D31_38240 [Bradyrhizobium liaoningense]|nr:hypothetical protein A1D31_38240 [Bradyrhizobium liaoningense]